ncbi:hypothetical protein VTJ04DRAFT_2181 [Mycothermus thermophilus]|uniref:uncharacterized protein n=1 Tax=Humicola insolens TaxID=85995 RepID=UPI0037433B1E
MRQKKPSRLSRKGCKILVLQLTTTPFSYFLFIQFTVEVICFFRLVWFWVISFPFHFRGFVRRLFIVFCSFCRSQFLRNTQRIPSGGDVNQERVEGLSDNYVRE